MKKEVKKFISYYITNRKSEIRKKVYFLLPRNDCVQADLSYPKIKASYGQKGKQDLSIVKLTKQIVELGKAYDLDIAITIYLVARVAYLVCCVSYGLMQA